jgi:hypothetical protein
VRLGGALDTLLGPERTTLLCVGLLFRVPVMAWFAYRLPCGGVWCGLWSWAGRWFENYTVDASIFVVKLSRANGGCLGTRSR